MRLLFQKITVLSVIASVAFSGASGFSNSFVERSSLSPEMSLEAFSPVSTWQLQPIHILSVVKHSFAYSSRFTPENQAARERQAEHMYDIARKTSSGVRARLMVRSLELDSISDSVVILDGRRWSVAHTVEKQEGLAYRGEGGMEPVFRKMGHPDLVISADPHAYRHLNRIHKSSVWGRIHFSQPGNEGVRGLIEAVSECHGYADRLLALIAPLQLKRAYDMKFNYFEKFRYVLLSLVNQPFQPADRDRVFAEVERDIFPILQTLNPGWMSALPQVDDWTANAIMHLNQADRNFMRRARLLAQISPRAAALMFAAIGAHLRFYGQDFADINVHSDLAAGFLRHVQALLDDYGNAEEADRRMITAEIQEYAGALLSGLLFFPSLSPVHSRELLKNIWPNYEKTLDKLAHDLLKRGIDLPHLLSRLSHIPGAFPETLSDDYLFVLAFGDETTDQVATENVKLPEQEQLQLWEVLTGARRGRTFRSRFTRTDNPDPAQESYQQRCYKLIQDLAQGVHRQRRARNRFSERAS